MRLVDGPLLSLGDVPAATGGSAGVFTIWYRDELLVIGRAVKSAEDARESNSGQADGARGRLRAIRRQPSAGIQRALARHFPADLAALADGSDAKKVSILLERGAVYRLVETQSGTQAQELYEFFRRWLADRGDHALVDDVAEDMSSRPRRRQPSTVSKDRVLVCPLCFRERPETKFPTDAKGVRREDQCRECRDYLVAQVKAGMSRQSATQLRQDTFRAMHDCH